MRARAPRQVATDGSRVDHATEAPTATRPPLVAPTPGRALHVLVVEDNPVNQEVARQMLQQLGHACEVVPDAEQALARIRGKVSYCCILMDWQLPGISGLEATRILRREGLETPVVGVSAHASEADRQRALDAGMDHFLAKPVRLADLRASLVDAQCHPSATSG